MTNNPGRHYVWLDEVPVPVSRPKSPTPTPPAPPSPAASGEIELLTAEEAGFARPATPEPVGVESAEAQNTVPLVKQEPTSPKPVENGLGSSAENPFDLIDDEPGADSGQATVITASGNTGEACEESNGHPDITDSTSNNASGEGSANGAGTAILGEAGAAGHGQGDAQEGHAQPTGEAEGNEPEQRQALVQGQGEQTAGGVGTSGHAQAAATTANDGAAAIAAEGTGSRRSNRLRVKMEVGFPLLCTFRIIHHQLDGLSLMYRPLLNSGPQPPPCPLPPWPGPLRRARASGSSMMGKSRTTRIATPGSVPRLASSPASAPSSLHQPRRRLTPPPTMRLLVSTTSPSP